MIKLAVCLFSSSLLFLSLSILFFSVNPWTVIFLQVFNFKSCFIQPYFLTILSLLKFFWKFVQNFFEFFREHILLNCFNRILRFLPPLCLISTLSVSLKHFKVFSGNLFDTFKYFKLLKISQFHLPFKRLSRIK